MHIDEKLNLVVPVNPDKDENAEVYFHSMPILRDTYRRYHFVMAKTFNVILTNDMHITGPRIAAMTLEEVATDMGVWEDTRTDKGTLVKPGVKSGLIEEIKRLTNIIVFTEEGWKPMPVDDAMKRDLIDADLWDDALQKIVFFMLASAILPAPEARDLNMMAAELWRTQLTSLGCSAFADSLPILMQEEIGMETASQAIC